ncbi:MAG: hypothetical protein MEQ74_12235 [Paracoccus sp.]|nr:hypothetical protein [Paracoccus sp. (in: a-proteobacteria)]
MDEMHEEAETKPAILVVLGPHRSGTSALTGMFSRLGANLPKHLMPENDGNARGYFESSRVKSFNDRLLAKMGSNWRDVLPLDLRTIEEPDREGLLCEAAELLASEFENAHLPILKDPRMCRLVDFWREAIARFGYRPVYIHTHRNPLETARSLSARHPISVETGLLIWLRHVLDAEAATRNEHRVFTNYQALLENWRAQVSIMEAATGIGLYPAEPAARQDVDAFLSGKLRHQASPVEELSKPDQLTGLAREVFCILESWTEGRSNLVDYDKMDDLRGSLDNLVGVSVPFLKVLEQETAWRKSAETLLNTREQERVQNEAERIRLASELDRLSEDGARREAEHMARLSKIEMELQQGSEELRRLTASNHQLLGRLEDVQTENLRVTEEAAAEQHRLEEELRSRDDLIAARDDSIRDRFDEIARISEVMLTATGQLEKERARSHEYEQGRKAWTEEHARLAAEIDGLRQKATELQNRVDDLLASTSWRVTGPLRRVSTFLRRR